jgi:hypothetical protein
MMKAVLLRVGIDSGCGGIQSLLFPDGSFEFVCIPDNKRGSAHRYETVIRKNGRPHSAYFPARKHMAIAEQHIHLDPEFDTFTYGDPTSPERSLQKLERGDYLIFYCGLQEWDEETGWQAIESPAICSVGYFVVELAGTAADFSKTKLKREFRTNFHVRYRSVLEKERDDLVLVKGGPESRLLTKAHRLSSVGKDRYWNPLKVLSPEMRKLFGMFDGRVSMQRSPPRWVEATFVKKAIRFVTELT